MPLNPVSFTSPYSAEEADIQRRQMLANALGQRALQPMGNTEMAGPIAIQRSPWEGAAKLMQGYVSGKTSDSAIQKERELQDKYQSDYRQMVAKGIGELYGTPAQKLQPSLMGDSQAGETGIANIPAQAPNPQAALETFGANPQMGAPYMPMAMQEIQRQRLMASQPLPQSTQAGAPAGPTGNQQPQEQASGFGGPAGGVPMERWLAADPVGGYGKYLEQLAKDNTPMNLREGGTAYSPSRGPLYTAPKNGIQTTMTPQGPVAVPVQGYGQAQAGITAPVAAAQAGGKAYGALPYNVQTFNTPGAPTAYTGAQAVEQATGAPPPLPYGMGPPPTPLPQVPNTPGRPANFPVESPAERSSRAQGRIDTLNRELQLEQTNLANAKTPEDRLNAQNNIAALNKELSGSRQPGMRLQDQGQSAEQKEFGKGLGDYSNKVQADAANAAVSNRYIDNMDLAAKDIRLGKFAPAQSSLIQWAQAAGLPVSEESKKAAGSIQALTSMAIKMAGTATRQSDAQPSQLQYFKILESMPNEARTADGFNKITAYLRDANNYTIAKQQNLQQWRNSHGGSAEGFEAQWPKIAEKIPFVWNQQKAQQTSGKVDAQAIVDELRKRGVVR